MHLNDLRVFLTWASILILQSIPNKIKSAMNYIIKVWVQQVSCGQDFTSKIKFCYKNLFTFTQSKQN